MFSREVLWALIIAGAWVKKSTVEDTIATSVLAIRKDLKAWYTRRHRDNPHEKLTRVTKFRRGTIGDPTERQLRTKGAETWGVLLFLITTLQTRGLVLGVPRQQLLEAASALEALVATWS